MHKSLSVTEVDDMSYEEVEDVINYMGNDVKNKEMIAKAVPIITLVLALVISIAIFCGIAMRKSEPKSKFVRWLKEFLNFRKIWIAGILKFIYIFLTVMTTIGGIVAMILGPIYNKDEAWTMILAGLAAITFGNIAIRLGFEMAMITIGLWENTAEIRTAVVKTKAVKEEKKEEKEE